MVSYYNMVELSVLSFKKKEEEEAKLWEWTKRIKQWAETHFAAVRGAAGAGSDIM